MNIQEVAELRKQLEEDYRKDTAAIDRVMLLLKRQVDNGEVSSDESNPTHLQEKPDFGIQPAKEIPITRQTALKFNFEDNIEGTLVSGSSDAKQGNKFGRVRDSGIKGLAKRTVPFLPHYFTRKEIVETMAKQFPESKDKLTRDAVHGALKRLLEDDLIAVHSKPGGKAPITYRKTESLVT